MTSPRTEFFAGVRAELPIVLGGIPFGLIYGVLAIRQAHLPPDVALAMSAIVFAGSSQFVGQQLMAAGTPGIVIVLTTFVINLRHALYSASVAPFVKPLRARWKVLLAYLLTDEDYAITITHYEQTSVPVVHAHAHWYFLGAGLAEWSTWQASTALGIFFGVQVPDSWGLDFTLALMFIALVVPRLQERASTGAALAASAVAIIGFALPYKLGLLAAALIGIVVGMFIEARVSPSPVTLQSAERGKDQSGLTPQ
jgi:4-azaleucine resistance transporter AzlC